MTGQSHSIRCPDHGFYYNPDEADGCVKCLEGPVEPDHAPVASSGGRGFLSFGLVLKLAVVFGLGWGGVKASQSFLGAMGERGGEIYDATRETASRIDPALVRSRIESMEALVYAEQVSQFGHGGRIQREAMLLYSAVMGAVTPLLGSRHGTKIVGFGNAASQYEDVGYSTIDMDQVRKDWEDLRADVFWDADWFRKPNR